jgi:hypothetical protein
MTTITTERTVTVRDAKSRLLRCFKKQRPVFLWGPPGVGKSEVVNDLTEELGGFMIDLRLGQMDPTDIRGIPYFNKELGVMDWAPPIDLPTEEMAAEYPMVTLFLDEMNSAAPAVQAAGYQLILNRRIGKYKLPDNVVIVAAGNRESDKGVTYRMPSPLANRFVHLEVRPEFESWLEWAVNKKIHKDVVGYLSFAKSDLFDFDPKSPSRAFATPRTWTFMSDLLEDEDIGVDELADLASGTIGEGLAIRFMAHRKVAKDMPNPEDILSGKVKTMKVTEVSAMYALVTGMCYELQEQFKKPETKTDMTEWHKMADNFLRFMMDNFTTELVVMGAKVSLATYNLPLIPGKLKNFNEFHESYGKYITNASAKN